MRPEFAGAEAEIGNYSERDDTYECWLIPDAFEGSYALCSPTEIEIIKEETKEQPATEASTTEPPATSNDTAGAGQPETLFGVGDRVRGKESGKLGTVTSVDDDGDPKVVMDGTSEALQRFGREFELVEKASFGVGDRVRGRETGKEGTVVSVDEDGDPKVQIDGEDEAKQRFGKEFEIVEKARDQSRSRSNDKKKGKKKKKAKSSSSSSSSDSRSRSRRRGRSGSSASSRYRKRGSAFGRSNMEKKADEKRRAKKIKKTAGSGANAALSLLGMR